MRIWQSTKSHEPLFNISLDILYAYKRFQLLKLSKTYPYQLLMQNFILINIDITLYHPILISTIVHIFDICSQFRQVCPHLGLAQVLRVGGKSVVDEEEVAVFKLVGVEVVSWLLDTGVELIFDG